MGLIAWIVVGAIAGYCANMIMRSRGGLLRMMLLGVVGAIVGGYVATSVLNVGPIDGVSLESIAIAVAGAIAVIFVARVATGSRVPPAPRVTQGSPVPPAA